jgi:LPS-assembly lipoprotein
MLSLVLLTTGCGFHPLYGGGAAQSMRMASIYVDIIPNRSGQLLRQALQARLEGANDGVSKQFTLGVSFAESIQGLGVQSDNSTTRNRDIGTAVWSLHPAGNASVQIAGGTVRSLDGYNIIDEQFFYADLSEEAAERRLAGALADQIVTGLAVYFEQHPAQG